MPNDNKKVVTDLKSFVESFIDQANLIESIPAENEKMKKTRQACLKLSDMLQRASNHLSTLEPDAYDTFCSALKDYSASMIDYISYAGSHHDELSKQEQKFYQGVLDLAVQLRAGDKHIKTVRNTLRFTSKFKATFSAEPDKLSEPMYSLTGSSGHMPTLEECRELSVEKSKPETVVDRLIWLQNMQYASESLQQQEDLGIYQNAFSRLIQELKDTTPETQALYSSLFSSYEYQLNKHVNKKYEDYCKAEPVELSNEKREENGYLKLATDVDFLTAKAFANFKNSFAGTRFGDNLDHISKGANGKPLLNVTKHPEQQLISGLANGEMEGFLKGRNQLQQVEQANRQTLQQAYASYGAGADSRMSRIGKIYTALSEDKGKASPSYRAMRDAMAVVANMNPNDSETRWEYLSALSRARDAARIYLDSHKRHRMTSSGQKRVDIASEMLSLMTQQYKDQKKIQRTEENEKAIAIAATLKDKPEPERLREISKLNKHITPLRIVPKEPNFSPEITEAQELKGEIKHQIYSAFHARFDGLNTIAEFIVKKKYETTEERPSTELELNKIPGRKGEKFKNFDPEDPANGGANQGIMKDSRRPPMVWEKLIPEDPNQPPTITFEFDQGREGDSNGYPLIVKNGEKENEMGHGFVTLRYTKTNPFTGEAERYKVSFGFYPKGGFIGQNVMATQIMKGMSVPGQLNEDNTHSISTGLTYTVNNQQINKVLLAAQHYEKDGYNYFDRNCTTFVKDMSKAAGIDLSNVLKEVDLTSEGQNKKYFLLNIGGGEATSYLGRRDVLSKTGRDDLSYQRSGQKMLNKEDVVRVEQSKEVFNKRMKGYAPGHATEAARVAKNFKLHSSKYNFDLNVAKMPNQKKTDEDMVFEHETKIRLEFGRLCGSIIRWGEKQGISPEKLEHTVHQVQDYTEDMLKALGNYAQKGIVGKENKAPYEKCSWADQKQALIDGTSTINEMIEGFDEIYRSTFQGEPELNIPFQHMVSILEHSKEAYADKYRSIHEGLSLIRAINDETVQEGIDAQIDKERDTSQAIRSFLFGSVQFDNIAYSPAQIAGMIQAFGSVENGRKIYERRIQLQEQKKNGALSKDEQKELALLDRKNVLIDSFSFAQKSYFEDRELTISDYSLAFIELPQGMGKYDDIVDSRSTPGSIYQAVALERVFGGTKKMLNSELDRVEEEIKNPQPVEGKAKKGRRVNHSPEQMAQSKARRVKQNMLQFLSGKIAENKDEFLKFTAVSIEKTKAETPVDRKQSKEDRAKDIADGAIDFMTDKILNTYLMPLMEDALENIQERMPGFPEAEEMLKAEDIKKLPEFAEVQKIIDKQMGVKRVDPAEIQRKAEEEARRLEEERRQAEEAEAAKKKEEEKTEPQVEEHEEKKEERKPGRKPPHKKFKKNKNKNNAIPAGPQ